MIRLTRYASPLAAGLLALVVGGCSRAANCPPGKACIRYMAWGNPEQLKVERQFVDRFNAQNPDVIVRLFTVPGSSYGQKMTTMLVSGTAPDVLRVDHYAFASLQQRGYFKDLTPLADADREFRKDDFFPSTLEEGTVNGRLYGLNVLFGGILIYYNKKLIQEAGLEDPYAVHRRGEWTWERFLEYAKRMTRFSGTRPSVYGTEVPVFPTYVPLVRAFGGELMTEDMKRSVVASPEAARGFQFLADLAWKHEVAPTPSQGANAAFTFESGKLGMTFNWMGMTPRYRSVIQDFEWDVVPVPKGPAGSATIVKGNQIVVAHNSRHPQVAWRFIRFMTGVSTETELYARIRRSFPTRRAVAESPDFLDTKAPPFNTRAFIESIEGGKPLPINERWSEWTQILTAEVDNLTSGRERDAMAVLRRAEAKINRALAEEPGF